MQKVFSRGLGLVVLVFVSSFAAWANVSGTPVLASGSALNLDTGLTVASGGDLLWNGTTLAPQGKAKAYNFGNFPTSYASFTPLLSTFSILASSSPIPASALIAGEVFVVISNGGNIAKMLIVSNSGGSLSLQFTTYIAAVPTGPNITQVWNNSSNIPAGYPNSGVTPSSLIAIVGTGLADPGDATLHSSEGAGLQSTVNGATVSVKSGSTVLQPGLYYATPTQIDAVLPASTPLGPATVTVSYKGAVSNTFTIQVVPSAVGITNYNGGLAVATDATTGALIGYNNSATPGEVLILWGTGLGADPLDSSTVYTQNPHQLSNISVQIYLGTTPVQVAYQGASVYPGVAIFAITIPQSPPTGCFVSLAIVAGGVLGNTTRLPVSASGGACLDQQSGLSGNQLSPTGSQTIRTGAVELIHQDSTNAKGVRTVSDSADAAFEKYTGLYTPNSPVSPGSCTTTFGLASVPSIEGLDAGVPKLTGPNALNLTLASQLGIKGAYFASLATGAIPSTGGTFTFTGPGGADVGSFTSTLTLANPLIVWSNPPTATIDRSQSLQVNWTGGNPGSYVVISGTSTAASGGTAIATAFSCLAPADDGKFTVPTFVLSALLAGNGGMQIQNDIYSSLTASGLDLGTAGATVVQSVAATWK